jgi:tripartite-type tricarboxylate transporter receptor subunit TctC
VFLQLAAAAAALPATTRMASASDYPTRPARILVGFSPGATATMAARIIAQWLSDRLGQQFIIENRPGAATNIAAEAVVFAPADGYTLLMLTVSLSIRRDQCTRRVPSRPRRNKQEKRGGEEIGGQIGGRAQPL